MARMPGAIFRCGPYDPVDLNEEETGQFSDELSELGFEYNVGHDIWMMPVVKNIQNFFK